MEFSGLRIAFPAEELPGLRLLLSEGKTIVTARILRERWKYRAGQVLESDLGQLRVLSVTWMQPGGHPYWSQLTDAQKQELRGHEGDVLKLISMGST